jgi:XapX domain-containing protein
MKEILLSVLTGFGCGVVFAAFKLPVPAPPVFAGVAGIIGLWIGYKTLTQSYILGGIMNNLLNDKTKAMLASYGRSVLGSVIALYMAGVTDPKDLWAALVAALAPVALRALNPNDKAFGVLPDTGIISDALGKIVPVKSAPKKKAAKKK